MASSGASTEPQDPARNRGPKGDETGSAAPGKTVYLDNNATSLMPGEVLDTLLSWCNRGDPSAEHASAREARRMMDAFRREIAVECGFELEGPGAFAIIFNSGASEGNSHIVMSAVRAYAAKTGKRPHVVTSAAEHRSVLLCCARLAHDKQCQLTVLPVGRQGTGLGTVAPSDLEAALRPNTCLVSIVAANGETGILNNLRELSAVAHRAKVPFHTDAAQLFGRSALRPETLGLDAFSASFHKLRGPPGVGVLVIRRRLLAGYDLAPHVCGPQNGSLRGGTENLPGIAAAFAAFRLAMAGRGAASARVGRLRDEMRKGLAARLPFLRLDDHPAEDPALHGGSPEGRRALARADRGGTPVVFWIAPPDDHLVLPNTMLLAVYRPGFCARRARAALEARGVIVGAVAVAPAGLETGVAAALNLPAVLRNGLLRVSLGDDTTDDDAGAFVRHFLAVASGPEGLAAQ